MPRPVICYNIKTIPDYAAVARANGIHEDDIVAAKRVFGDEPLPPPFHKVVAIGALTSTYDHSQRRWNVIEMATLHIGDRTEKELIAAFLRLIECTMPTLISDGHGMILPILRSRAQLYRLSCPHLARFQHTRFTDMFVNLKEQIGASRMSMDACCRIQRIGETTDQIDDAALRELVEVGDFERIAVHSISLVCATYALFLLQEVFAGRVSDDTLDDCYASLISAFEQMEATRPTKFVQA